MATATPPNQLVQRMARTGRRLKISSSETLSGNANRAKRDWVRGLDMPGCARGRVAPGGSRRTSDVHAVLERVLPLLDVLQERPFGVLTVRHEVVFLGPPATQLPDDKVQVVVEHIVTLVRAGQRDRRAERDPKRTTKFKSMRADGQEFNEGTHHYLIDDVVSGRWFGKEHGHETRVELDLEAMSKKPCHAHDHDMFSLVSNKYGREYHPNRGDPKKDFITMNAMFAKFGGTVGKGTKERGSSTPKTRGPSTLTYPSKTELATACNALVDPDAAPFMLRWLESQATNGDKISFMKAFQALSKSTAKKPTAHVFIPSTGSQDRVCSNSKTSCKISCLQNINNSKYLSAGLTRITTAL